MFSTVLERLLNRLVDIFAEATIAMISQLLRLLTRREKGVFPGSTLYVRVQAAKIKEGAFDFLKESVDGFCQAAGRRNCWVNILGNDLLLFVRHNQKVDTNINLVSSLLLGTLLQRKARDQSIKLSLTLHWENNAKWLHLWGRSFVIGSKLNRAQFLTSFAEGAHFFISESAYRELKPLLQENKTTVTQLLKTLPSNIEKYFEEVLSILSNDNCCCLEEFIAYDREKLSHKLYNFYIKGLDRSTLVGTLSIPPYRVAIEYRRKIDDSQQAFIERLVQADEVSIIGLTHENTADFLQKALKIRQAQANDHSFWRQLSIIFPSKFLLGKMKEENRTYGTRLNSWERGRRSVFQFLLGQGSGCLAQWECLEYNDSLPFVGNRFITIGGASVRVAPILPGADMKETYYMEMFRGTKAYDQLSDAFIAIRNNSTRMIEWDLFGKRDKEEFCIHGIINRKSLHEIMFNYCLPVVLVILYAEEVTGYKVLLQKRVFYNASSDIGTFSNISGHLTDRDVYTAEKKDPPPTWTGEQKTNVAAIYEFYKRTGLTKGCRLSKDIWETAAIRELKEEIGLEVTNDRLKYHCSCCFGDDDCSKCAESHKLFFNIFSLKLRGIVDMDEVQQIKTLRPRANLFPFDLIRLQQYYQQKKFNRLLQVRFKSTFLPIFETLGIVG